MPEWQETAPPEFQQLTPANKTYMPGTAADDDNPAVDYITFEFSPTKEVDRAGRAGQRQRGPEPGGRQQHRRL